MAEQEVTTQRPIEQIIFELDSSQRIRMNIVFKSEEKPVEYWLLFAVKSAPMAAGMVQQLEQLFGVKAQLGLGFDLTASNQQHSLVQWVDPRIDLFLNNCFSYERGMNI